MSKNNDCYEFRIIDCERQIKQISRKLTSCNDPEEKKKYDYHLKNVRNALLRSMEKLEYVCI